MEKLHCMVKSHWNIEYAKLHGKDCKLSQIIYIEKLKMVNLQCSTCSWTCSHQKSKKEIKYFHAFCAAFWMKTPHCSFLDRSDRPENVWYSLQNCLSHLVKKWVRDNNIVSSLDIQDPITGVLSQRNKLIGVMAITFEIETLDTTSNTPFKTRRH